MSILCVQQNLTNFSEFAYVGAIFKTYYFVIHHHGIVGCMQFDSKYLHIIYHENQNNRVTRLYITYIYIEVIIRNAVFENRERQLLNWYIP